MQPYCQMDWLDWAPIRSDQPTEMDQRRTSCIFTAQAVLAQLSYVITAWRSIIYSIISHDCAFYMPAAKLGRNQPKVKANRLKVAAAFCMFHERCTHDTYWNYTVKIQTYVGIFFKMILADTGYNGGTVAYADECQRGCQSLFLSWTGPLTLAVPVVKA